MEVLVLQNSVFDASDYFSDGNYNPRTTNFYCFANDEALNNFIQQNIIQPDSEEYNDGYLYRFPIETINQQQEVAEAAGISWNDFVEMLGIEYSERSSRRNYGEFEKDAVGKYLANYGYQFITEYVEMPYELPNYNFNESIDGCIVVVWSWNRYVGYSRNLLDVRYANYDETKQNLTKSDETFHPQMDILLTAEEVKQAQEDDRLLDTVIYELTNRDWRWSNYSEDRINI